VTATAIPHFDAVLIDPLVELMGRITSGHDSAFTDFYGAVSARVYGLVNRVLHNSALSAEVTQDVFMELWTQSDRYDAALGSVMGWVLTIAHRRAVDLVRHEERSHRRDTQYTHDNLELDTCTVHDHVEHLIDAERVRRALSCLTDRQRQAVELSYFGGYSNSEIARLLGIPVSTTKTRIRDGLIRLRRSLAERDQFAGVTDD
jgi:RNA polymerase sigma-70 factor, ECF subfamily